MKATYEITAKMNLKNTVAEAREVAQALNEFADNLERIEKKYKNNDEITYTPEEVSKILIIEGQEHGRKYGLKLGDTIKFTPLEVMEILKSESEEYACNDCRYNDGKPHAECVLCDKKVRMNNESI